MSKTKFLNSNNTHPNHPFVKPKPDQQALFNLAIQRDLNHYCVFEKVLRLGDVEQRVVAARALGWMKSTSCVPALILALQDSDPTVRRWSVASLALSWDNIAASALCTLFVNEPNTQVRVAILCTLGWRRSKVAGEICIAALTPTEVDVVRGEAIRALGRIDAQRYIDLLLQAIDDTSSLVRQYALRAILYQPKDLILSKLIERSHDADPETRAIAMRGLGYCQNESVVKYIIEALNDSNPCVRANAAIALGKSIFDIDLKVLLSMSNDPHPEVRLRVSEAIQKRRLMAFVHKSIE